MARVFACNMHTMLRALSCLDSCCHICCFSPLSHSLSLQNSLKEKIKNPCWCLIKQCKTIFLCLSVNANYPKDLKKCCNFSVFFSVCVQLYVIWLNKKCNLQSFKISGNWLNFFMVRQTFQRNFSPREKNYTVCAFNDTSKSSLFIFIANLLLNLHNVYISPCPTS